MKQYASSPVIQQLIADRHEYFQTSWTEDFYNLVWNVDTAQGFGLDIWGRIVVIGRNVTIESTSTTFGFYEAWSGQSPGQNVPGNIVVNPMAFVIFGDSPVQYDDRIQPFDQAPFYDGNNATETVTLTDEAFRQLIIAKALANIADCTMPTLNKMLRLLFGSDGRRCYAQTSNLMDLRYVFEFELSPVERTIAAHSGIIPRPAGVRLKIMQIDPDGTFGFAEGEMQPFDQGTFFGDNGVIDAV